MNLRILLFLLSCIFVLPLNLFPKIDVYFSPGDAINKELIERIRNAKKKIYAAVYMITDKTIAEALIDAYAERGIDVQVVTDSISAESSYGKVSMLAEKGVPVYVFAPSASSYNHFLQAHAIMHNKFAIIDNDVWTGSFNWTRSASSKNKENVVSISHYRSACNSYLEEFNQLKEQSILWEAKKSCQKSIEEYREELKKLWKRIKEIKKIMKKIESGNV